MPLIQYRNNVHKLYYFIFLVIPTDFFVINVLCLNQDRFDLPERYRNILADTEFRPLIDIYKPIQLSLGAPDMLPPSFLLEALSNLTSSSDPSIHQYLSPQGSLELRTEIAGLYSPLMNYTLDPTKNVMVTLGGTEALYLIILVHTLPGEEWIVIEPAYERYYNIIKMCGGTARPITLKPKTTEGKINSDDFVLDKDEVRKAFNPRTKGILINNPHNPTGKVFTKEELMFIADLAKKWNTLIISDEVYEWSIFDPNTKFIRMATLGDDTFNRTITVSSMSKTYFATGWRIGWAIGSSKLIGNIIVQQPNILLTLTIYSQLAVAEGLKKMRYELGHPDSYFIKFAKSLESKRNYVIDALNRIGMKTIIPQSGYYVFANWTTIESRATDWDKEEGSFRDIKFIKWLIKNAGITAAPGSAFYSSDGKNIGENFVRICYAKKLETLQNATTSLLKAFNVHL